MKSRQTDLSSRVASFGANPIAEARARAVQEAVRDALLRRFDSYAGIAAALTQAFGHVSDATVKAAFNGVERNYVRLEWAVLVLDDADVRAAMAPPPRDPAEELARTREHMAKYAPGELERFDRRMGRIS